MSNKFNQRVKEVKTQILNECKLFQINYQDFLPLSNQIISTNVLDEYTIECCKTIVDELNEGHFRLIFCGQLKSGKSRCIIEFLSGKLNLPSCETPTTTFFTAISFSDDPILYSMNMQKEVIQYDFDGKNVSNSLVGRHNTSTIHGGDLEVIYHVGTPHTFNIENFVIIDTPGLNETKNISEAFFKNFKKLNPQLIVYLFKAGPGFTTDDHLYCTNIIANARNGLKKIFLFNKYDDAFKEEPLFMDSFDENSSDDEVSENEDESESEAEEEKPANLDQYQKDYEIHLKKLLSFSSEENELVLLGYSGKLVQKYRQSKDNPLPFLLSKHIDFLSEIQNQINIVNQETNKNILHIIELYLYMKFKLVHDQILRTKDTAFGRLKLEGEAKKRLLNKFDEIHAEINVHPPKINQLELEVMINEIIENQVKQMHETIDSKLKKITNSLVQFFTNRYFNLFSNVIQGSLECISFASFTDEIRNNDLQSFFPHAFCTLKHEVDTYNLSWVIENYFREQTKYLSMLKIDKDVYNFQSPESFKQYFKAHLKYDIDSILPTVEDYKKIKLNKERKLLDNAIDKKINEINSIYEMTEQETESMIRENLDYFKIWIKFNNNYITAQSHDSQISIQKRKLLSDVISDSVNFKEFNCRSSETSIICKMETMDFDRMSCQNSDMIQYFLRSQLISHHLLKCYSYFHENSKHLYFITDLSDFQPMRIFLPKLIDSQKSSLIRNLVDIIDKLYANRLPIDNFGPDMIFGRICSDTDIEIKLVETVQRFHQWEYSLDNGDSCNDIFFKLPVNKSNNTVVETILSMFYSFGWMLLLILHGKCSQLVKKDHMRDNYRKEINKLFKDQSSNMVVTNARWIIDKCLKDRFANESLTDIFRRIKLLEKL